MDCTCFYPCTLALIETFTATSVIRQRMLWAFVPSSRSLSFKSQLRWYHCWDDRPEILPFCIRCCRYLSLCREPGASRPGPLTRGDYRRRPGEPPALTFHYIFHYISHPCSWWQLAPWQLRRGDASHRADIISSHTLTHTCMNVCSHSHTNTLNAGLPAFVNPRLLVLVYKSKGHGAGGGSWGAAGGLWQSWHPIFDLLLSS